MKLRLAAVATVLLLISNGFMTAAWYGHLKFEDQPMWKMVLVSWGIAFFEYCFQVPANRIGHEALTATQLKGLQEIITLVVFVFFAWGYLKEPPKATTFIGFALIAAGAFFIFKK